MEEAQILEEMRIAVTAEKNAGEPAGWVNGNGDGLNLVLPVEIVQLTEDQPVTLASLRICWRAVRHNADRDVSASLIVTLQGRDYIAWRMDWRPINPHVNRVGPAALRGLTIETGIHGFAENALLGVVRMQAENLPICVPVESEPHDFDAFVRFVCAQLNVTITDGNILSPPWSATLF